MHRILTIFLLLLASRVYSAHNFTVLTYNVAGLPDLISASNPKRNNWIISPLLNDFDITLLQEDFNYHKDIVSRVNHPYQSHHSGKAVFGDGLTLLSQISFSQFARFKWNQCHGIFSHGSDCLTPKGFSMASVNFGNGHIVDIYNLHADAGDDKKSFLARQDNIRQIADAVSKLSFDRTIIIAGDFNARYTRSEDNLEILNSMGFRDPWVDLERDGRYPEKGCSALIECEGPDLSKCEKIDKIFYRSVNHSRLIPISYSFPDGFVDEMQKPLSDHVPVAVEFVIE